jgi:hypothetical protein
VDREFTDTTLIETMPHKPTLVSERQPPLQQTSRDTWVNVFGEELRRLRPQMTSRLAWTLGLQAYAVDADPLMAARAYDASHEATKPRPLEPKKRSK